MLKAEMDEHLGYEKHARKVCSLIIVVMAKAARL